MARTKHPKSETHRRIVEAAAAALRERGVSGIGVAELMREAGLTHGGFYAHFKSKDELVAEALAHTSAASRAAMAETAAGAPPGEALLAVADAYLTSRHREHPERGCAIAALAGEILRQDGAARQRLSANIGALLARLATYAPAAGEDERRRQATGTFAAMLGGLILARGVGDPNEADRILAEVRAFLRSNTSGGER